MNTFEKTYYLKNKLGLKMSYKETMQTLEFAKRNNLVDGMVELYKKEELLNQ